MCSEMSHGAPYFKIRRLNFVLFKKEAFKNLNNVAEEEPSVTQWNSWFSLGEKTFC